MANLKGFLRIPATVGESHTILEINEYIKNWSRGLEYQLQSGPPTESEKKQIAEEAMREFKIETNDLFLELFFLDFIGWLYGNECKTEARGVKHTDLVSAWITYGGPSADKQQFQEFLDSDVLPDTSSSHRLYASWTEGEEHISCLKCGKTWRA